MRQTHRQWSESTRTLLKTKGTSGVPHTGVDLLVVMEQEPIYSPTSDKDACILMVSGESELIEGMNHLDLLFMSANTSAHRKNEIIPKLNDFMHRFSQ